MVTKKILAASVRIKTADRVSREARIRKVSRSQIVQEALDAFLPASGETIRKGSRI